MYGFLFLLISLQLGEELGVAMGALAALYAVSFVGIVAGYFWARWFSVGLGISGLIMGGLTLLQLDQDQPGYDIIFPKLVFYTATHLAITVLLWGNAMARHFDGRKEWRERFHLDESATNKLGKSVIRVGVSLPFVLLMALVPKEEAALALFGGMSIVVGAWALVKMRTWSIPAMGAGAVALFISALSSPAHVPLSSELAINLELLSVGAIGFTMLALTPFISPILNFLRTER